jgi:hypothetical protein
MALVAHHQDPVRSGLQGGGEQGHCLAQVLFGRGPVRCAADREQDLWRGGSCTLAVRCRAWQEGGCHFRGKLGPVAVHTEHLAGRRVFARHRDQPVDKPVDLTAEARGEQGAVIPACQLVPAEAKEPFGGGVGQGDAAVPGHIQDRVGAGIQDRAEYRHC